MDAEVLARAIVVTNAAAPWLNQEYHFVLTEDLQEALHRAKLPSDLGRKGPYLYLARRPSPRGPGTLPHLWYDAMNCQWKLATIGFKCSHYLADARGGAAASGAAGPPLPAASGLPAVGEWRPGPRPREADELFPEEIRRASKRIRLAALGRDEPGGGATLAPAAAGPQRLHAGSLPEVLEHVRLAPAEAREFRERGFLVKGSAELGTRELAGRALRVVMIAVRDRLRARGGAPEVDWLDWQHKLGDKDWGVFADLLYQSPALWTVLTRMMLMAPQAPRSCSVAVHFPEGTTNDDFRSLCDDRLGDDYHIDGRGNIPNKFTVLVGVALNDQFEQGRCQSWGGFTVFPRSHVNSALHRAYPAQKRGATQGGRSEGAAGCLDLGEPQQLRLRQGDVVLAHSLLAHRRGQNWSESLRCMAFFRLRPAERQPDWQEGLLEDPFVNLRGVVAAATTPDGPSPAASSTGAEVAAAATDVMAPD